MFLENSLPVSSPSPIFNEDDPDQASFLITSIAMLHGLRNSVSTG